MSLEVVDVIKPDDHAVVKAGLAERAVAKGVPPRVTRPLAVMKRDNQNKIEAGLCGETFWTWLYVDEIWVHEDLRGHGLGRTLMQAAETEAIKRGCTGAYLWTQDFNAPGFYEKLGYERFVEMSGFPTGHQRIGFMKQLAA